MAITLDSTLFNGGPASESSTHSFSFNNTSGTFLIISVSGFRGRTISSLTYNGVSLTQGVRYIPDSLHHCNIWYLANPAIGNNTVSITLSGNDAPTFQCSSWTGVSGIGAASSGNTGTSASPSCSITTTKNNSVIIDCLHSNGNSGVTRTPTYSYISGGVDTAYGTEGGFSSYREVISAGASSTDWTTSDGTKTWWITNIEITPISNSFIPRILIF